jgi:hypothetical protein
MRPLKRWRIALLLAAAAVFSARADDAVYKCKGNVFQDHPCNGAIPASTAPSTARLQAQAEHNNAVSAAQLGQIIERQQQQCGGELAELPTVGMSDETFRECTMLARFGETNQIVVSQAGGVALRLYVFPTAKLRRVYSIGGVVTAIKP